MYPVLGKIGPFTVYSYGFMLMLAFLVGIALLIGEWKRKDLDPRLLGPIVWIAVLVGMIGAKLTYTVEHPEEFTQYPWQVLFAPGGFTFYGGGLAATVTILLFLKSRRIPLLPVLDAAVPSLILGYSVARVGCHLSGDGDYGLPSSLPWSVSYAGGTYPPSVAFKEFPELVQRYGISGVIPDTLPVHPTALYESGFMMLLFGIFWIFRKRILPDGKLFFFYLLLISLERFFIEFFRARHLLLWGFSLVQVISLILLFAALLGLSGYTLSRCKNHLHVHP